MNQYAAAQRRHKARYQRVRKAEPSAMQRRRALQSDQARNRPQVEKRAIWESIKRHAPELEHLFKTFPGSVVLRWEENGKTIGEDYSI